MWRLHSSANRLLPILPIFQSFSKLRLLETVTVCPNPSDSDMGQGDITSRQISNHYRPPWSGRLLVSSNPRDVFTRDCDFQTGFAPCTENLYVWVTVQWHSMNLSIPTASSKARIEPTPSHAFGQKGPVVLAKFRLNAFIEFLWCWR